MAGFVLSECGLRPLPRFYPQPTTRLTSTKTTKTSLFKLTPLHASKGHNLGSSFKVPICSWQRNWELNVASPASVITANEKGGNEREEVNGVGESELFDPGAPPPFNLADIRAAIPKHCWVKDPWKSMSYVVRDVVVVFGLAAVAAYFNNWVVWPLYWFCQGTMFWALFVLGHDWYAIDVKFSFFTTMSGQSQQSKYRIAESIQANLNHPESPSLLDSMAETEKEER